MSGPVLAGLMVTVAGWVGLGVCALYLRRDTPGLRFRRAGGWARRADLALDPELVDVLAERVQRDARAMVVAGAVLVAPVFGLTQWLIFGPAGGLVPGRLASPFNGPAIGVVLIASVACAGAVAHAWGVRHRQRAGGPRVARLDRIRMGDAVPLVVIWGVRLFSVVTPAVALAAALAVRHHGYGSESEVFVCAAPVGLSAAALWGVERGRRALLNGRQSAGTAQELAFDDDARLSAAVAQLSVAPAVAYLGGCVVLQPLFAAVPPSGVAGLVWVQSDWQLFGLPVFLFLITLQQRNFVRYYRRGVQKPPTSESAPC